MTVTPVGMRCPECARDRVRATRPDLAGLGTAAAPATYVLIAINVVTFLAELVSGGSAASIQGGGQLIADGGLNAPAVADGEWYRLVTAAFLHAGPLHVLLNMFALYILGSLLEPGIGTARFIGVYVVSLLAGSLGALLVSPDTNTVGASGAVFGLMSAAFIMARRRGLEGLAAQIGFYVVLNLAFTFGVPGISIGGHLGGLAGGAVAALLIALGERHGRHGLLEGAGMIVVAAACFAGALAVAAAS